MTQENLQDTYNIDLTFRYFASFFLCKNFIFDNFGKLTQKAFKDETLLGCFNLSQFKV